MSSEPVYFKADYPSCRTALSNGKIIHFQQYIHRTDIPADIAELDAIASGVTWLRRATQDEIAVAPVDNAAAMAALREAVEAEVRAKIAAEQTEVKEIGEAGDGKLKPISTAELASLAATSDSTASASSGRVSASAAAK